MYGQSSTFWHLYGQTSTFFFEFACILMAERRLFDVFKPFVAIATLPQGRFFCKKSDFWDFVYPNIFFCFLLPNIDFLTFFCPNIDVFYIFLHFYGQASTFWCFQALCGDSYAPAGAFFSQKKWLLGFCIPQHQVFFYIFMTKHQLFDIFIAQHPFLWPNQANTVPPQPCTKPPCAKPPCGVSQGLLHLGDLSLIPQTELAM